MANGAHFQWRGLGGYGGCYRKSSRVPGSADFGGCWGLAPRLLATQPASGHCHGDPLLTGTLVAEARVRPVSNRHISRATGIPAAAFLFRPCRGLPRCLWKRQIRHRHPLRPLPLPWAHHTIGCIMPAMACIATMKHDLHAAPQRRGGRHSPKMAYQYGDLTPSGHSLGVSQVSARTARTRARRGTRCSC